MTTQQFTFNTNLNFNAQVKDKDKATKGLDDITDSIKDKTNATNEDRKKQDQSRLSYQKWLGAGLSSLFLMQAMGSSLRNMLSPAANATGIFEIWNATLTDFFAPSMSKWTDKFAEFSGMLSGINPEMKEFIGDVGIISYGLIEVAGALTQVLIFFAALKYLGFLGGITAMSFAVASLVIGLAALAAALVVVNWEEIKMGLSVFKDLLTGKESIGDYFKAFGQMSDGGFFGRTNSWKEFSKMFFSPIGELFGMEAYTPEGWRDMGYSVEQNRPGNSQQTSYSYTNIETAVLAADTTPESISNLNRFLSGEINPIIR